jgi:uncharacterized protein (DUF2336 family)
MSSLAELDHAVASCDPARRDTILARLTAAFLEIAPRLSEPHVTLFDHVMLGIGRTVGDDARAALALAITPVPNAPLETTRRLALDEVARVAAPILMQSTRVTLDALTEVATLRGPAHLVALAARPQLDPSWAEPLARRADRAALVVLAANPLARTNPVLAAVFAARIPDEAGAAATAALPGRIRSEEELLYAASNGQWDMVASRLAGLAGSASSGAFSIAVRAAEIDPLLICLRAADLDWEVAGSVIESRFGSETTPDLIADAALAYGRLTRDASVRAMQGLVIGARMRAA